MATRRTPDRVEAGARGPRATLLILRVVAMLHAAAVAVQPVLAGMYLSGEYDVLGYHNGNALLVLLLGLAQLAAAVSFCVLGHGRVWPTAATLGLAGAEITQAWFGWSAVDASSGALTVHIPLGVAIVVATIAFTSWTLGGHAGRSRDTDGSRAAA